MEARVDNKSGGGFSSVRVLEASDLWLDWRRWRGISKVLIDDARLLTGMEPSSIRCAARRGAGCGLESAGQGSRCDHPSFHEHGEATLLAYDQMSEAERRRRFWGAGGSIHALYRRTQTSFG